MKGEAAARRVIAAARKVPVVYHQKHEPFLTCIGCGEADGNDCKPGCWALELEDALGDFDAARKAGRGKR